MSSLADYLSTHADGDHLDLVGPLCRAVPQVTEPVIFVDGGANFRQDRAGFSVGDGDSGPRQLDQLLNPDKAFSDLAYVLGQLGDRFKHLSLHGFLGARRDHELLNLGEVHHFLAARTRPMRATFEERIVACSAGIWQVAIHGTFSVAVIEPARITLAGQCRYLLDTPTAFAPLSSLGLSNEGSGQVEIGSDGPFFLFLPGSGRAAPDHE